jgi:deoxycytidylate deaminase
MSNRRYVKATIYNKRGHVIAVGENSYSKTHPLQISLSQKHGNGEQIYLHAELAALVRLKDWSKAYRIKVERYGKKGEPLIAKPCPICQAAIDQSGIQVIEHT